MKQCSILGVTAGLLAASTAWTAAQAGDIRIGAWLYPGSFMKALWVTIA